MVTRKLGFYALILLGMIAGSTHGSITYVIPPHETSKPGWSFDGGSITTDGTLGDITPENFESWHFSFTSPAGQSEIVSTNGGAYLIKYEYRDLTSHISVTSPSLVATTDQLFLKPGSGALDLAFSSEDLFADNFYGKIVAFGGSLGPAGGGLVDNRVNRYSPINPFDFSRNPNQIENSPQLIGDLLFPLSGSTNSAYFGVERNTLASVVIAIPEPTSLLLFSIFSCIYLSNRRR